jgi:anti-sigma-K factor RskA
MSELQHLQDLADLVATGGASEQEVAELERLLAEDPANRRFIHDSASAVALLGEELEPIAPPPNGLEQIRAAITASQQSQPSGEPSQPASEPRAAEIISLAERRRKRSLALSIVMAGAAAASTTLWLKERSDGQELQAEVAQVQHHAQKLRRELAEKIDSAGQAVQARFGPVTSPDVQLAQIRDAQGAKVNIFVDPSNRRWLVFAFELPQPAPDKDYQLWFVPQDGKPISAGLLEIGPDGILSATPQLPKTLGPVRPAISLEKKGGADQPTDIKLVGETIKI